jgi:hypothetical protein
MKVEIFDRHAEHVDESIPLCDHEVFNHIYWGDTVKVSTSMELSEWIVSSRIIKAKAEVEIHLVSKDYIRIIVNHGDYLAVKKAQEIVKEFDEYAVE